MTRSTKNQKGLGKAILNEKSRQVERLKEQADKLAAKYSVGLASGGSVLEQSNLDDLIATVQMKKEAWADEVGEAEFVPQGPTLVSYGDPAATLAAERAAIKRRDCVSIPRRPQWKEGMSVEELAVLEAEAFMDWRRGLSQAAQDEGLYLTPYERNLDFWRQLWRCMERSDLLVQIVDARDPDFYHCRDLGRYVQEMGGKKKLMILVNKADFLPEEQRQRWVQYFEYKGIDAVFFSALREVRRQNQRTQPLPLTRQDVDSEEANDSAAADGAAASMSTVKEEEEENDDSGRQAAQRKSVFMRAGLEDADEESQQQQTSAEAKKAEEQAAKPVDGALVPIPDSDEDEDLDGEAESKEDKKSDVVEQQGQDDEEEEEAPLGPGAEDELPGVLDSVTLLDELVARLPDLGEEEAAHPASSSSSVLGSALRRGTIGFVGYPNVGKSTVINALVGSKRVGMSRTPGKTKHIQTLELQDLGVTLCDCPGLVFPSVAATKAHLVINNTVHIDDLRECFSPIALIVEKVGWKAILNRYDCASHVLDARARSGDHVLDDAHAFLAALAVSRNHLLRVGVPDENWAARKVLKDYVTGALLHCEEPPSSSSAAAASSSLAAATAARDVQEERSAENDGSEDEEEGAGEDFGDLESYLRKARGGNGGRGERNMTKRRMRHLNKQIVRGRGAAVESAGFVGVHSAVCHGAGGTGGGRGAGA